MSSPQPERRNRATLSSQHQPGAAPGTLYFNPSAPIAKVKAIGFGPAGADERTISEIPDLRLMMMKWPYIWINVDGVEDSNTLQQLGQLFMLHPLALEDVQNTHQRPKLDQYPDHLFIVMRTLDFEPELAVDQVSIFVGDNYLVTFQQRAGDPFDHLRRRILKEGGAIRTSGMGFLAYSIVDAIIDHYFPVMEAYGEKLEDLENEVIISTRTSILAEIYSTKRDLFTVRKAIWPLRDVVNALCRDEFRWISADTRVYMRDCYDHTVQLLDLVETNRELCSALMEFYLSCQGTRMNEVMKVLTIISTLFIPLTFIVGVYGMNFEIMPELKWEYGYAAAWIMMITIVAAETVYFWSKGWLSPTGALDAQSRENRQAAKAAAQAAAAAAPAGSFREIPMPTRVENPNSVAALRSNGSSRPPADNPRGSDPLRNSESAGR